MSLVRVNLKKELFTLSMLRYNMDIYKYKDKKKYNEFAKQVDIQEYYLYNKHRVFPGYKSEKNIIFTLNHLSKIFNNKKSPCTVYSNGFIFSKNNLKKSYVIVDSKKIVFPVRNDIFSYCNVNERECQYLKLHFLLMKSFESL